MGSVTGQVHVMMCCTWRAGCLMREHNDPEGWTALDTRQSATCIVIHWTDACVATCIGIDSSTLFVRFLAQKSRGICTDGHNHTWEHVQGALAPKCAWDTHQLHVRYAWNMGYSSTP